MKNKFMGTLLSVLLIAVMATSAMAEFVYVTKSGKKYHPEGSRFLVNKEAERITIEEAEDRGLEPSREYLKQKEDAQPQASAKSK